MIEYLYNRLKNDPEQWVQFGHFFEEKKVPAKTTLLKEGEVSRCMFFVRDGCLRINPVGLQVFMPEFNVSTLRGSFIGRR